MASVGRRWWKEGDGARPIRGTRGQRVENPRWTERWRGVLRHVPQRTVLYKDPRASPWPLRVTGVSYARARQRPGGLTVSPHARFGTASGGGRKCGEKRRGVGRRAAPRTAGHPSRGRDTCGSEGRSPPRRALPTALATRRACCLKAHHGCPSSPIPGSLAVVTRDRYMLPLRGDRYT